MEVSLANSGNLPISCPSQSIVITVCNPKFEIVSSVGCHDSIGILWVIPQLQWGNIANDKLMTAFPGLVSINLYQGLQRWPGLPIICWSFVNQVCPIKVIATRISSFTKNYQGSFLSFKKCRYFKAGISFSLGGERDTCHIFCCIPCIERYSSWLLLAAFLWTSFGLFIDEYTEPLILLQIDETCLWFFHSITFPINFGHILIEFDPFYASGVDGKIALRLTIGPYYYLFCAVAAIAPLPNCRYSCYVVWRKILTHICCFNSKEQCNDKIKLSFDVHKYHYKTFYT